MAATLPYPGRSPDLNARDYYLDLQDVTHAVPFVLGSDLRFEEIDVNECYIRGTLFLVGGYELHIAEYVVTEPDLNRPKYRYHLQSSSHELVTRWDNAPHHRSVSTFPHHRHDAQGKVHPTPPVSVPEVLDAILPIILPPTANV
jgi:hypothetical protein